MLTKIEFELHESAPQQHIVELNFYARFVHLLCAKFIYEPNSLVSRSVYLQTHLKFQTHDSMLRANEIISHRNLWPLWLCCAFDLNYPIWEWKVFDFRFWKITFRITSMRKFHWFTLVKRKKKKKKIPFSLRNPKIRAIIDTCDVMHNEWMVLSPSENKIEWICRVEVNKTYAGELSAPDKKKKRNKKESERER